MRKVVLTVSLLLLAGVTFAFITDMNSYAQPSLAAPAVGSTYQDPVFDNGGGEQIRRIATVWFTNENYSRNGFWSASGRYTVRRESIDAMVIDATTGADVRFFDLNWPFYFSFDPVDDDKFYYSSGSQLRSFRVSDGSSTLVKDFGQNMAHLGGSVDFIDNTGRYFIVNYGGLSRVWDKQTDTVYSGGTSRGGGGGWVGISPSADYVIANEDQAGCGGVGCYFSYAINHQTQSVGPEKLFWTLCGGHGDIYICE